MGSVDYLRQQFNELESNENIHPTILATNKNFRFGELYSEFHQIIQQIKGQTGIQFDYLYDGKGFFATKEGLIGVNRPLIYVHSGGFIGNSSMIERYTTKFAEKNKTENKN